MNIQEAKDKFVDILRDDLCIKYWRNGEIRQDMSGWCISSKDLRSLYNIFDQIDTIEKPKVALPKSVSEWVDECKKMENVNRMVSRDCTPSHVDDWLDADKENLLKLVTAYYEGYKVEELFYAKIKGWDKVKNWDGLQGDNIYWNYYEHGGLLLLANKTNSPSFQTIATIKQWNELGIDQSNAVFEEA